MLLDSDAVPHSKSYPTDSQNGNERLRQRTYLYVVRVEHVYDLVNRVDKTQMPTKAKELLLHILEQTTSHSLTLK